MNGTILLIDDNTLLMKLNCEALTQRGYRVLESETISKGRLLLESENPDLIMMETILPDGSGLEFCTELQNRNSVPVMFVSMKATEADELAGLSAGGSAYVKKLRLQTVTGAFCCSLKPKERNQLLKHLCL